MQTYWLYLGNKIVTSVRAPKGTSDGAVRYLALDSHRRNPTVFADFPNVAPFEQAYRISCAEVKTYD